MPKDNQVLVRVNDQTHEAIQEYKQDRDFNKAEACRRMIETRLVSEGYMEGLVRSDGGIEESLSNLSDEIEQEQQQVSALSREIKQFKSDVRTMSIPLFVGLLWIGLVSVFSLPSTAVVGTGLGVIVLIVGSYLNVADLV